MPITAETISLYAQELGCDPTGVQAILSQMNPFLYYTLMSLVQGSAYTILEQVEEENGCEAYRRLYLRYAKTKMQNAIMRIATIVNTRFHDTNFETTFTEWGSELHKIEVSLNSKIDDTIKIGILIAGTTGKLHDHLCLTLGDTISYDETRDVALWAHRAPKVVPDATSVRGTAPSRFLAHPPARKGEGGLGWRCGWRFAGGVGSPPWLAVSCLDCSQCSQPNLILTLNPEIVTYFHHLHQSEPGSRRTNESS